MSEDAVSKIKFIVDFEQMGDDFSDALRDALKSDEVDVGIPKSLEQDIAQIRENVMRRLVTPIESYSNLLASGEGLLERIEKRKGAIGEALGKNLDSINTEQDKKDIADLSANLVKGTIQEAMKSPSAFRRLRKDISKIQNLLGGEAVTGSKKALAKLVIDQLIAHDDVTKAFKRKYLQEANFIREESGGYRFKKDVKLEGKYPENRIETTDEYLRAIEKTFSEDQAKELINATKDDLPRLLKREGMGKKMVDFIKEKWPKPEVIRDIPMAYIQAALSKGIKMKDIKQDMDAIGGLKEDALKDLFVSTSYDIQAIVTKKNKELISILPEKIADRINDQTYSIIVEESKKIKNTVDEFDKKMRGYPIQTIWAAAAFKSTPDAIMTPILNELTDVYGERLETETKFKESIKKGIAEANKRSFTRLIDELSAIGNKVFTKEDLDKMIETIKKLKGGA